MKPESDLPAHATLHELLRRCVRHAPLDTVVMEQWMDTFRPCAASVFHLRQMRAVRGSHPLIRRAVVQTIMHCLRDCNALTDEGCKWLAVLVPCIETVFTCDPEHGRLLQSTIECWLGEQTVSVTPHVLRCVAVLWEHNLFDIRGCFERMVPPLCANVDVLDRLIHLTWTRQPRDGAMLQRLLAQRAQSGCGDPSTSLFLGWDAAVATALQPPRDDGHPNREWRRSCNQCSLVYAYATVADDDALLRYARRCCPMEIAMPPRLAILLPLEDDWTANTIRWRLTTAYQPHLRKVHRVVASSASVAWWMSWMGYLILFMRRTPQGTDATVMDALSTSTVVSLLGCSLVCVCHKGTWSGTQRNTQRVSHIHHAR